MKKVMLVLFVVFGLEVPVLTTGCSHTYIDLGGECETDADCGDGVPCTIDICGVAHTCIQIDNCDPECTPTEEVCDGLDNDCDEVIDEDTYCAACAGGPIMPYYRDSDGDGYGDPSTSELMCSGLGATGWIDIAGDCDDSVATVNPDAQELCDSIDNDCDGETDEDYRDGLGDTCVVFSTEGQCADFGIITCNAPGEMFQLACDSSPPGTIWSIPGSIDMCGNGLDDNCNGTVDEDCLVEVCNGLDDDSDGNTDEGLKAMFYLDMDHDGYGNSAWFMHYGCPDLSPSPDWVLNRGDCDDTDVDIHPGAGCPPCGVMYYRDADSDGQGDPTSGRVFACEDESVVGYIITIGDCDDSRSAVHIGADEICNGLDDNCDGLVDEDCP